MSGSLHQQAECLLRAMAEGKKTHRDAHSYKKRKVFFPKKLFFQCLLYFGYLIFVTELQKKIDRSQAQIWKEKDPQSEDVQKHKNATKVHNFLFVCCCNLIFFLMFLVVFSNIR